MKLSTFKQHLSQMDVLRFRLPDGNYVPVHAHITEIGRVHKHFIDCGGTIRDEHSVSFQLWESVDVWHRLSPDKLLGIIDMAEQKAGVGDHEIEVEYQGPTIQRFGVEAEGNEFRLTIRKTACLAEDQCGIPQPKEKRALADLTDAQGACCQPGGSCC